MSNPEKSHSLAPSIIVLASGTALAVIAYAMGLGRIEIASAIVFTELLLVLINPPLAVMTCFTYLALVGDIRRLMLTPGGNVDPLLLVGPVVTAALLLRIFIDGLVRFDTAMAKMMLALLVLMAIQVFNPKQGGFSEGFAGAVIYAVPACWYFIGRAVGNGKFTRALMWRVLLPIAVAGALLGMYQTFFNFLSFERHWINTSGYTALFVGGGKVRPFGFFVSAAEYALFLSMGCVVLISTLIARRPKWMAVFLLLPLLATALFIESSRTPVALLIAATCAMWGATAATNFGALLRMGMALIVVVGILVAGLAHLQDVDLPDNVRTLVDHQKAGFLDMGHSTAGGHAELVREGIVKGFKNPFGEGIGSTVGGGRYGGVGSSEVDISDMFICLGLGGILYAAFVVTALARGVRHFREAGSITALATVGILVGSLGAWIYGSMYAAAPIFCFLLGTIDPSRREQPQPPHPVPARFRPPVRAPGRVPQPVAETRPGFGRRPVPQPAGAIPRDSA